MLFILILNKYKERLQFRAVNSFQFLILGLIFFSVCQILFLLLFLKLGDLFMCMTGISIFFAFIYLGVK